MNYDSDMPPYIQEMADWLDDTARSIPATSSSAYKGAEIMLALYAAPVEGGQVALPLTERRG